MQVAAVVIAFIFSFEGWTHFQEEVNAKRLVIYKVPGHSAIDLIHKGQSLFLSDSSLTADEERLRFHIRPNRVYCGVASVNDTITGQQQNGFEYFMWNNKKILWIKEKKAVLPKNIQSDYVIIANNSVTSKQLSSLQFEKLILDSSNTSWYADKMKEEWNKKANVYSVLEQGAFIERTDL